MPDIIAELREKFEIENIVGFDHGAGNMPRIVVTAAPSEAYIYLHGAHVSHYRHRGQAPLLFLSEKSYFQSDRPIRGGVPICWPWFGPNKSNPNAPMHGLARISTWQLESTRQTETGDVEIVLSLTPNALSRSLWPNEFALKYTVTIGDALDLALTVTNTGDKSFSFEEALHTYFAVSDIRQIQLLGLGGSSYTTKVGSAGTFNQPPDPLRFVSETDSVYTNNTANCTIVDPTNERQISVQKEGSNSTVVWNPWIAKAKAMPDFGDDEWPHMLCVETANVWNNAITLAGSQSHTLRQRIVPRWTGKNSA
ncbi:MAG TPA: D-hexose-6-phosphate mutarotase [Tepidisphaeraceae bacterium]|nr:D-hexose-6-phosphate mutarotase [Tepidisphaeraceae bacterium]